jgi:HAE1 family hydrophobic/amphiphilic exporter-1
MNLPGFSIRRPVTTIMIYCGVLLFGVISLINIPQELFPPISYPQVTIVTTYENAAPAEIETLITRPIEEVAGTVAGVRRISSISKEGLSLVIADFGWEQNMDFAALGVREKIDLIKERLPRDSEEPIVMKFNPFDLPVITLSVTSAKRHPAALRELSKKYIKDELEKVEGVAAVSISGGLEREILIEVDQGRLNAQNVSIVDVTDAVSEANLNYPAGTIKESFYEYLIRTLGEFEHVGEIGEIAIIPEKSFQPTPGFEMQENKEDARSLILLKDIAKISDAYKERTSFSRFNAEENVSISIQKQAQANTLKVVESTKNKLNELRENLPNDIKMEVVYDQSVFIKESINGVRNAAWQGGVLAFLILFYFLRNVWSSVVVTLTIPISIMATFCLMYFGGITLNMMSMGGLALGVGMLVDSAVVVVENIFRYLSGKKDIKAASELGTNEVFNAITASTLTTVVVFLPLVFIVGIVGQLFKDLALTVTYSLAVSLIAAVTLIPMLASKSPERNRAEKQRESYSNKQRKILLLDKLGVFYSGLLKRFINARVSYLAVTLAIFVLSMGIFALLDKEVIPKVDQGQFAVKINMPTGTKLEITDDVAGKIESLILDEPSVEYVNVLVGSSKGKSGKEALERLGSHQAEIFVSLKKERDITSFDLVQKIKSKLTLFSLRSAKIDYVLQENVLMGAFTGGAPIVIEIKGDDLESMSLLSDDIKERLNDITGVYGAKDNLAEPSPETKVFVDKDKAARYGLSVADIAQAAQVGIKGYVPSEFKEKGQEIDIRVRLRPEDRDDFAKISRLQLTSPSGNKVPLFSVASFSIGEGPSEIKRLDQQKAVMVSANIYKRPLKDIISDVEKMIDSLDKPKDITLKLAGESEEMSKSFDSLRFALILAIVLIYMIMAAQFESLWQPFIIMFTVPLALIGVALALYITNTSLNVNVIFGVIILGGIVVNNAIVLIDCINMLRQEGMPVKKAVMEASNLRLRPIMMTALTTALGLLPMALMRGPGSELRAPMAISVMGGLVIATFLTLVVIPTLYLSYVQLINFFLKGKNESSGISS